jgi:5-oxoprolinase (ATP-hydrolysing)
MAGGKPGQKGQNFLGRRLGGMDKEERQWINIGGTKEVDLRVGDRIMICTPGGGGYGLPAHDARRNENRTGVDDTLLESSDRDLDGPVGPAAQEYWPRANGTIAAYVNAGLASA